MKCKHCKKEFEKKQKKQKYCSRKCQRKEEHIRNRKYYLNYSKEDYYKNWKRYSNYRKKNKDKIKKYNKEYYNTITKNRYHQDEEYRRKTIDYQINYQKENIQ